MVAGGGGWEWLEGVREDNQITPPILTPLQHQTIQIFLGCEPPNISPLICYYHPILVLLTPLQNQTIQVFFDVRDDCCHQIRHWQGPIKYDQENLKFLSFLGSMYIVQCRIYMAEKCPFICSVELLWSLCSTVWVSGVITKAGLRYFG